MPLFVLLVLALKYSCHLIRYIIYDYLNDKVFCSRVADKIGPMTGQRFYIGRTKYVVITMSPVIQYAHQAIHGPIQPFSYVLTVRVISPKEEQEA